MDAAIYLASIRDDAADLVAVAERAGMDAPVPSCPDWHVADLLEHIGRVHRWAADNTVRSPDADFARADVDVPEPAERGGVGRCRRCRARRGARPTC